MVADGGEDWWLTPHYSRFLVHFFHIFEVEGQLDLLAGPPRIRHDNVIRRTMNPIQAHHSVEE